MTFTRGAVRESTKDTVWACSFGAHDTASAAQTPASGRKSRSRTFKPAPLSRSRANARYPASTTEENHRSARERGKGPRPDSEPHDRDHEQHHEHDGLEIHRDVL